MCSNAIDNINTVPTSYNPLKNHYGGRSLYMSLYAENNSLFFFKHKNGTII